MSAPGTFCTAVLQTRDIHRAARFYQSVFGWTLDGECWMLNGQRAAAIAERGESTTDRWVPYFVAGDRVRGAPIDHHDPEGAVFGTCVIDDPRAVTLMTGPGSIWWVEVLTHRTAEAKAFYRDFFGWTFVERAPLPPHPLYIICMRGMEQAAGILPIGPGWDRDVRWQVLFEVEDLEASTSVVVDAGGSIDFGPLDVHNSGLITSFHDPGGALFLLAQPYRRAA
jgi:predicted enzyme related to lactoylglutathione lyase